MEEVTARALGAMDLGERSNMTMTQLCSDRYELLLGGTETVRDLPAGIQA